MHLRFIKKLRLEVSLYDPIGTDKEGNEITLIELLGTNPEMVPEIAENNFDCKNLMEKLKQLTPREKMVLEMRYGLGGKTKKTQREIARSLGISRSYISRIEKKALKKLISKLE